MSGKRKAILYNLSSGLTDYMTAWRYQKALSEYSNQEFKRIQKAEVDARHSITTDSILLVQHPSVYTLGKAASVANLKFEALPSTQGLKSDHSVVYRVERGGEVTWHGPGQLVAYPILNLNNHKKDLHWYTNRLEESVIETLRHYGIKGTRSDVNTGVWVEGLEDESDESLLNSMKLEPNNMSGVARAGKRRQDKICAVGVTASRWVTMHGAALNVNADLLRYKQIVPCGIDLPNTGVCSMESILQRHQYQYQQQPPSLRIDEVAGIWMNALASVFDLELINGAGAKTLHNKIGIPAGGAELNLSAHAHRQLLVGSLENLVREHEQAIAASSAVSEYVSQPTAIAFADTARAVQS